MALAKQNRLGSSRDFGKVHRKGARAATEHLAVRALAFRPTVRVEDHKKRLSAEGKPSALSCDSARDSNEDSAPQAKPATKFGISISRKVSKKAVVRNRIKRQIKAIIRQMLPDVQPGWQVVIVVRTCAVECEFDDFLRELEYLLKKLKIVSR